VLELKLLLNKTKFSFVLLLSHQGTSSNFVNPDPMAAVFEPP
jgi:hypothetical protein